MPNVFDVSHLRARALLASGAPVFLPINPVEYHGPHLSLHNDALVSQGLTREIHAELTRAGRDWPLLVASDSRDRRRPHAGARVAEHVLSGRLQRSRRGVPRARRARGAAGRSRHFPREPAPQPRNRCRGALARSQRCAGALPAESPPPGDARHADRGLRRRLRHGAGSRGSSGAHARSSLRPSRGVPRDVAGAPLCAGLGRPDLHDPPPCPEITPDAKLAAAGRAADRLGRTVLAAELRFAAFGLGWHALRPFPGYTSRPRHASREAGAVIARHIVGDFAATTARVLAHEEPPPAPIMPWIAEIDARRDVRAGRDPDRRDRPVRDGVSAFLSRARR